MPIHNYDCGTLAIANGAAVSAGLAASPFFRYADTVTFLIPAVLTNTNLKVQVSDDGGTTYFDLLDTNGDDYTGAPSDALSVPTGGWDTMRLLGAVNEGAARTINVTAREHT